MVEDVAEHGAAILTARTGALEHVANRPIADHVLDELELAGVEEVVVVSSLERASQIQSALADRVSRNGFHVQYVGHPGPVDIGAALTLAAPVVGAAPCIVHLASGLLGESLAPFVMSLQKDAPDVVLAVHHQPAARERLSRATQDLLHIAELRPDRTTLGLAGVWLFGPGALRQVAAAAWHAGDEVDLTNVVERIADAGGSFVVRVAEGWRKYDGDPLDLLELNQIALDRLEGDHRRSNADGNRIEGRVRIHETASVDGSVIVGPTVIGAGVRIADAYIGPYTAIGARARIEGAEVERSIIAPGASITHIGGRLVASVVGRDARVFRDFSLPRALRLRVGDRTVIALS